MFAILERGSTLPQFYVCAKLLQAYQTLCDPMDYSPSGSLPMGFSRQEYWSRLPCPPPGNLPDIGMEPMSLMSPSLAGGFSTAGTTWERGTTLPQLLNSNPRGHP